jgi:hypothetical protein
LSIPLHAGAQNIALDLDLPFEAADQICIVGMEGHELGDGLAVFCDQNSIRPYSIE